MGVIGDVSAAGLARQLHLQRLVVASVDRTLPDLERRFAINREYEELPDENYIRALGLSHVRPSQSQSLRRYVVSSEVARRADAEMSRRDRESNVLRIMSDPRYMTSPITPIIIRANPDSEEEEDSDDEDYYDEEEMDDYDRAVYEQRFMNKCKELKAKIERDLNASVGKRQSTSTSYDPKKPKMLVIGGKEAKVSETVNMTLEDSKQAAFYKRVYIEIVDQPHQGKEQLDLDGAFGRSEIINIPF